MHAMRIPALGLRIDKDATSDRKGGQHVFPEVAFVFSTNRHGEMASEPEWCCPKG